MIIIKTKKFSSFSIGFIFLLSLLMNFGCTPGMFGDVGGKPTVTMIGEALSPVDPAQIKVQRIGPPGTSTYDPRIVNKYIKKHFPNSKSIADISASSTGYGDNFATAEKKLVKMAGKLGFYLYCIQVGTNPWPVCQALDRRPVGGHLGQSRFSLINRTFEGIKDTICTIVSAETIPEALYRT